AQDRIAMCLLVEVGLDSISLVGTEQTRFAMCVGKLEALATGDDVLERNAPLFGQTFNSLSGHPVLFYKRLASPSNKIVFRTASMIRRRWSRSMPDFNERNSLTLVAANFSRQCGAE